MQSTVTIQLQNKSMRKPKLAPVHIYNSHHIKYVNERTQQRYRHSSEGGAVSPIFPKGRPYSVPGNILLTNDQTESKPIENVEHKTESRMPSRPSTQNTIRDGIIIRWDTEDKLLLRRPRTSSDCAAPKRNSARLTRVRFGAAITTSKAKTIVNSMSQAAFEFKEGKTAADLCMEATLNPDNPYSDYKDVLVKQYRLWNGYNMDKTELPPIQLRPNTVTINKPLSRGASKQSELNRAIKQLKLQGNKSMTNISPLTSCHVYSRGVSVYNPGRCSTRLAPDNVEVPLLDQYLQAMNEFL